MAGGAVRLHPAALARWWAKGWKPPPPGYTWAEVACDTLSAGMALPLACIWVRFRFWSVANPALTQTIVTAVVGAVGFEPTTR